MKRIILIVEFILIITLSFFLIFTGCSNKNIAINESDKEGIYAVGKEGDYIQEGGDFITKKETALKIGRAILEEYAYIHWKWDSFEEELDAEEKDGIWTVYNIYLQRWKNEDDNWVSRKGGGIFVKFKQNGEVLAIGTNE